jgi:hypothetical protein
MEETLYPATYVCTAFHRAGLNQVCGTLEKRFRDMSMDPLLSLSQEFAIGGTKCRL